METLRPLNGHIVVEVKGVEVRPSGLHIPLDLKKAMTVKGLVHAVSDGTEGRPCPVNRGDVVLFCPAASYSTVVNDKTYLFLDSELILGVIEGADFNANGHTNQLVGVN